LADAKRYGTDPDADKLPNYLDVDSDGDGTPDKDEPGDRDGNGVPDYLSAGGVAGGALCSAALGEHAPHGQMCFIAVLWAALVARRRRASR
jgi:hypothetical protein